MRTERGQTLAAGRGQTLFVRRGQALVELALGLFTLALVVSVLCVFAVFMAKSLRIQNHLRSPGQATCADSLQVDAFAADRVIGMRNLHIMEPRGTTDRTIR